MLKLIKSKQDYEWASSRIDALLLCERSQEETDELELLIHLIKKYDDELNLIDLPSPIDAIKCRMKDLRLQQKDLVRYFGSTSKVSEVLNRKRPLNMAMIRALHAGLKIPYEVLLHEPNAELPNDFADMNWKAFPLAELYKRGFTKVKEYKDYAEEIMRGLFLAAGSPNSFSSCLRQGNLKNSPETAYAILAWELVIRKKAKEIVLEKKYSKENFTNKNLQRLANLSIYNDGALKAKDYLEKHGIILIIEEQFKKSHLDGVAMILEDGTPVIGLSLRFDRIDYFWFTLFHELIHIMKHLSKDGTDCILDLDVAGNIKEIEKEANELAKKALISDISWNNSEAKRTASKKAILSLAHQLDIHPAIVAGQIRKHRNNYKIHANLLGSGIIRKQFETLQ